MWKCEFGVYVVFLWWYYHIVCVRLTIRSKDLQHEGNGVYGVFKR